MRNELRAWTLFAMTLTWCGCLIGTGVGIHEATTVDSQAHFMILFGALFVAGAAALAIVLPHKE